MGNFSGNSKTSSDPENKNASKAEAEPRIGMRASISLVAKKFPSVKTISTGKLHHWMFDNRTDAQDGKDKDSSEKPDTASLVLLDCRPEDEYSVSHLEGAVRVGYPAEAEQVVQAIPHLSEKGEGKVTVVCYCAIGYRASAIVTKLQKYLAQHTELQDRVAEIYNLEGSIFKWANEGKPMVDSKNESTPYAHPYNSTVGKLYLDEKCRKF